MDYVALWLPFRPYERLTLVPHACQLDFISCALVTSITVRCMCNRNARNRYERDARCDEALS